MAEKQIVQKIIKGKNIYEYTGDFGGTLTIVENDPLYEKITGVLNEAEDLAKFMIEERAKNITIKESVMISYEDISRESIKISSLIKNVSYTPDIHGVVIIDGWMLVVNASENVPDTYNLLVYRPCGTIESARFASFNKTNILVVNFIYITDGTKYVEISQIPKEKLNIKSESENINVVKDDCPTKENITNAEIKKEAIDNNDIEKHINKMIKKSEVILNAGKQTNEDK